MAIISSLSVSLCSAGAGLPLLPAIPVCFSSHLFGGLYYIFARYCSFVRLSWVIRCTESFSRALLFDVGNLPMSSKKTPPRVMGRRILVRKQYPFDAVLTVAGLGYGLVYCGCPYLHYQAFRIGCVPMPTFRHHCQWQG